MKNNKTKLSALFMGLIFLFSIVPTSLAQNSKLDFGDYYDLFTSSGKRTEVYVGNNALAGDTLGGIGIIRDLQFHSKETVKSERNLSRENVEGTTKDIPFGEELKTEFGNYTEREYSTIDYDDDIYNFYTEYEVKGMDIAYSASNTAFEDKVALRVPRRSIERCYVFNDDITISDEEDLIINFDGLEMQVESIENNMLSIISGTSYFLDANSNESVKYDGSTISLVRVGTSSAVVKVNDVVDSISVGSAKTIEGVQIFVSEIFPADSLVEQSAKLRIGERTKTRMEDGKPAVTIGEPNDDSANFVYDLKLANSPNIAKGDYICYELNKAYTDADNKSKKQALFEGDILPIPNGVLSFDGLTSSEMIDFSLEPYEDSEIPSAIFELSSSRSYRLKTSSEEYDSVFISSNLNNFVDDNETNIGNVMYMTDNNGVTFNLNGSDLIISASGDEDIIVSLNSLKDITSISHRGLVLDLREESLRTKYGILVENPDKAVEDNELRLDIPLKQLKAKISIGQLIKSESIDTISSSKAKELDVKQHLDSEYSESGSNLIFIGGPCAGDGRPKVEDIFGISCEDWHDTYKPGEAIIQMKGLGNGNVAILVAGTDEIDTRMASMVLENYEEYDLTGTKIKITGSLSSPTVSVVE